MAWPNDRLRTYVNGVSQVDGNDLNAIQDAIIGQQHGLIPMSIPAVAGSPLGSASSWSSAGSRISFQDEWHMPLSLPVGSRIVNLRGYVVDSVNLVVTMGLWRHVWGGATANLGEVRSAGTGCAQTLSIGGINETIVDASYYYVVRFSRPSSPSQSLVYKITGEYDTIP